MNNRGRILDGGQAQRSGNTSVSSRGKEGKKGQLSSCRGRNSANTCDFCVAIACCCAAVLWMSVRSRAPPLPSLTSHAGPSAGKVQAAEEGEKGKLGIVSRCSRYCSGSRKDHDNSDKDGSCRVIVVVVMQPTTPALGARSSVRASVAGGPFVTAMLEGKKIRGGKERQSHCTVIAKIKSQLVLSAVDIIAGMA